MTTLRKHESLSLIRDPKSAYLHYRYCIPGLPRCQASTKEKRPGRAWKVALEAYEAAKLRARGDEPEPTTGVLVQAWVAAHALGWSTSHVANVERFGRLHLGPIAELSLSRVTTAQAEKARNAYLEAGHRNSTGNLWTTYLRLVFRWALERHMIRTIPWRLPRLKVKKRVKPRLPEAVTAAWLAEVDALSASEPSVALVIRLMTGIGLRCAEARSADWAGLDLARQEYTPGLTKGGDTVARPMPAWLVENLRPLAKPCGPMVPTREGRLITPGQVQRVMDEACRRLSIPRLTPHRLRHSYATWLSEEGVPIQDIQAVLEQKDIKTTAVYLGVDLSRVRKAQGTLAIRLKMERRKVGGVEVSEADGDSLRPIRGVMHGEDR